jgi:Cu(I)/Ag(I) efflux system membrane fusion protein
LDEKGFLMSASEAGAGRRGAAPRSAWLAVRVLLVRLRSFILLAAVLLLVASWPTLRGYWDRLTRPAGASSGAVSLDTEYWCPMCPGVVSDWPGKCPVCNMALVRRQKGEPAPLPDGVLARMQLSPYRVQLAGVRTAPVAYRLLRREVVLVGTVVQAESSSVLLDAEAFEKDLPFLAPGRPVRASCDSFAGRPPFSGEVIELEAGPAGRSFRARVKILDAGKDLRAGALVTARLEGSILRAPWWRQAALQEWRDRTAVELAARAVFTPALAGVPGGVEAVLRGGLEEAASHQGWGLAVGCEAVIDHGSRKVAFVQSGPGMFDAVEVVVGPRCGDHYPVIRGLELGQSVAVAGAFLLDAEMWLNHGAAAAYFGASRQAGATPAAPAAPAEPGALSPIDRQLAARQKVCPVTGEPLDSMGGPVRVEVGGRVVFVCCEGCSKPLRDNPAKYLAKLPPK